MSETHWWGELAAIADDRTDYDRFSAAWYAEMERLYLARFPEADQRSKTNMRDMAVWAERREMAR